MKSHITLLRTSSARRATASRSAGATSPPNRLKASGSSASNCSSSDGSEPDPNRLNQAMTTHPTAREASTMDGHEAAERAGATGPHPYRTLNGIDTTSIK